MKKLEDQSGIVADPGVFLKGKIVDGTTTVGQGINQDIVQFFQKLRSLAGITANDLEDNEVNGYQTIEALISYLSDGTISKIFEIGTWDMDSDGNTAISMSPIIPSQVRDVTAIIIIDGGASYVPINGINEAGEFGGRVFVTTPNAIVLNRTLNGFFDSASYSGPGNRGYVIVKYIP